MLVELSRLKEAREAYAKSPLPPPVVPVIISDCVSEDRIKGHHIMLSNTLCQGIDDPLPSLPELIGVMNELK